MGTMQTPTTPKEQAIAAREAGRILSSLSTSARVGVLKRVADALVANAAEILAENAKDVAEAAEAVEQGQMSAALAARLKLDARKLEKLADGIRDIAAQEEPLGKVLSRTELADGMTLQLESAAMGVVMVIFESRPDALPQVAALALRSGNGLLLKGGKEAARSNRVLHRVITEALLPDVPSTCIALVESREEVASLLDLDDVIDLVIPRGGNALVSYIQRNTRIPVLGHADGICHVYVDASADMEKAKAIVVDSKVDYPAACNALETMLVHQALVADGRAQALLDALVAAGVRLEAGPRAAEAFGLPLTADLHKEWGDLEATVEIVDDLDAAIDHIHRYGSAHTDCIVAENSVIAEAFLARVDSACIFHNVSTRFSDGYRFGLGAEVGISTSRIHARGPVGVEGLLTTRYKLRGQGDVVAPFSAGEREFTHKKLPTTGG